MNSPIRPNDKLLHRLLRWLFAALIHFFYPHIEVRGRENLPQQGPVIFVLNHPNGLMDPLLLMVGLKQRAAFLAKSTLFANPIGRTLMEAFGALPIFRRRDDGLPGGPQGDAHLRNEETFAHCRALLRAGQAMALFPEGRTHSGSQLLRLRTGAARIALSAEAEADWKLDVQIVPVGLWYERKTDFRSGVLLVVGDPISLTPYAPAYAANERQTAKQLTHRLQASLDEVVLQAENEELLAAVPVVAAWSLPGQKAPSLPEQHAQATTLLAAYRHLQQTDPARLEAIAHQARRYAQILQTVGVDHPWRLELPPPRLGRLLGPALLLLLSFPLALAGFILSYPFYRLAGPLATWAAGPHSSQTGTFKLLGGGVLVLLGWILAASGVGIIWGGGWGWLTLSLAPPLGYAALRWGETRRRLSRLLFLLHLRRRRGSLVQALIARRRR